MDTLKNYFITKEKSDYHEGEVIIFSQDVLINKDIESAELSITSLGVYEVELNQKKVGDQLFAPGFTYYHRHLYYQQYDVKTLLNVGTNGLKVYLGQGWYAGRFTHENLHQIYGEQPAISWVLKITFADGTIEEFVSNTEVNLQQSKYLYAGFYDGEIYDEREEEVFQGKAEKFTGKLPEVFEKTTTVVKVQEEMSIQAVHQKNDKTIIDFGQNFAGVITVNPEFMQKNETITIKHGELLTVDGNLYTSNLREAKAELRYTSSGKKELFRPRFTYMGFRYIEISGVTYQDGLIQAHVIHNEMKQTGQFETTHKKVQRLFDNQLWGQKSNYVEVPTDCPQRDERQGYTGDGQVFALTGSFNFDTEKFWDKFLKDIHYSQLDNTEGYVAPTIPANGPAGIGFLSMLGWGNAITIIPKMLQQQYGTDKYLKGYYPNMKKFVDAEIRKLGDDELWLEPNLGDWLMPEKGLTWMAMNHGPVSNSFIVNDLKIISELAKEYGYTEDYQRYSQQLEKTRQAYLSQLIDSEGIVTGDYQGGYLMALQYVVDEPELKKKMLNHLVRNIKKEGMQTGFFSTEFLLPLLTELGETKLAFDLLLNENYPGWLYQVNHGATTMWERWDAIKEDGTVNEETVSEDSANMVSFNHYAFGSVGKFYYQNILGIQTLEPGYKKILLKPVIDERLGQVSGTYESRAGKIESSWQFKDDHVSFSFSTPSEAVIVLPDGSKYDVLPGDYYYEIKKLK